MSNKGIDRRSFIKKASGAALGAVGFPYLIPSSALGKAGTVAPSNRINLGCIGMGIQGLDINTRAFMENDDLRVVAICDVSEHQRWRAKTRVDKKYGNKDCAEYTDFRELIARKDVDACLICTPDNWHVLNALEAVRNGKDVYVEKAMGLSLTEDKALRKAVNQHGAIFQFGTQQRSSSNFRFGCELVRNGRIGNLHTILVGTPSGISFPNQPVEAVPKDLDYDMWLGPAPMVPYSYHRCRPYALPKRVKQTEVINWKGKYGIWYHISDYCLGPVGGYWGVHHLNIAQWGNGTDGTGPIEIEGTGKIPADGIADNITNWHAVMKYANGVKLEYMDTETIQSHPLIKNPDKHKQGVTFIGDEGWVFVRRYGEIDAHPKSLLKTVIGPDEIHLMDGKGRHERNFLDSVKSRKETICSIESSVRTDTLCHLTNIAIRLGRKLHWDPVKEDFVNDSAASRMLTRPMRSPWRV